MADDGVGIPPELDLEGVHTFGLRIAHTLTLQLDGTILVDPRPGTTFRVVFPFAVRPDDSSRVIHAQHVMDCADQLLEPERLPQQDRLIAELVDLRRVDRQCSHHDHRRL